MRLALPLLGLVALGVPGITWLALEVDGVAVVETRGADGTKRETHVWWLEREGGRLWLEAGTPENPWFVDVQRDAMVVLRREGRAERFAALAKPAESRRVRTGLRDKYGWRDRWVGLFVDSSQSVAVELVPAGGGA